MKRSAAAVRKPPSATADDAADDAISAAVATGAARRFREERARLIALGVVDNNGKRLRTSSARKLAATTDTRRW